MKTQQELFDYLAKLGIKTTTITHEPLFTCEQAKELYGSIPGGSCKNLFLKDEKKNLWLITALFDTKIELKKLSKAIGAPNLRFADAQLLMDNLGLEPGSVTTFGIINDLTHAVHVILDQALFKHPVVNIHPLKNDATTSIAPHDLEKFIISLGSTYQVVDFANLAA